MGRRRRPLLQVLHDITIEAIEKRRLVIFGGQHWREALEATFARRTFSIPDLAIGDAADYDVDFAAIAGRTAITESEERSIEEHAISG